MREIVDINSILRDFYNISGTRISIHDIECNEIYSYPKEPALFCRCLQEKSEILKDCRNNDRLAFSKVKNTGEVYVYKCRRGLFEAVAPLYHYGVLSGYLMLGQIREDTPDSANMILQKAKEILGDNAEAVKLAETVKAVDRQTLDSYINIMTVLAEYITDTGRVFAYNERLPLLIKEYINKNYASPITLSILSQKFGCCNATLTKSFKKEYNLSIMQYLCSVRLKKSAEMLVKTRKSIKEIAALCGFYDQNYFSKNFTRYYGVSPTCYRAEKE